MGAKFGLKMGDSMIERYGGSLFSCMDEVGTCAYTCCCPACAFGSVQEHVGDNCFVCCCAWAVCSACAPCIHASQRDKVEMKLGGQPKGLVGQLCCTTFCCWPCAICQEKRAFAAHNQSA